MKKSLRYILLLAVCCCRTEAALASDTLRVKTKPAFGTKGRLGTSTVPSSPSPYSRDYRGQPRCDTSATTVILLDVGAYFYGLYIDKHHSRTDFLERVRRYAIDTTRLTARRTQSYVGIFAGLRGPRKRIIVDANNNHDFSDDTAFDFDTLTTERAYRGDTVELAPIVRVQYETINRKEVQAAHTYLRIKPYDAAYGYPQDI